MAGLLDLSSSGRRPAAGLPGESGMTAAQPGPAAAAGPVGGAGPGRRGRCGGTAATSAVRGHGTATADLRPACSTTASRGERPARPAEAARRAAIGGRADPGRVRAGESPHLEQLTLAAATW